MKKLYPIFVSLGGLALLLAVLPSARALTITPTFDSTITSDPNAAAIEAGINQAIARVAGDISNNTAVTITFAESTSGLGGSSTLHYTVPYSSYVNALETKQTLSLFDTTAIASLGYVPNVTTANPVNGNGSVNVNTALARALGLANYSGSDGTISLNTSIMNFSRTGAQNSGFYDLQAVAGHEIDEVLGIGGPGSALQLSGAYAGQASPTGAVGPLDLYRYSATGARSFTMDPNATAYFSINGGAAKLVSFNQNGGGGADFADWGNGGTGTGDGSGNSPAQLQDAFGGPGAIVNIGANELAALDVIGYNVVPEAGGYVALSVVALALGAAGCRRRFAPAW